MCLISTQTKPLIAKKDMIVYKLLEKRGGKLYSIVRGFNYKLSELYQDEITTVGEFVYLTCNDEIDRRKICKKFGELENWRRNHSNLGIKRYKTGFHSFTAKRIEKTLECWTMFGYKRVVVECIIPKGSEYYRGIDRTLLVSNQIIIKRVLSHEEVEKLK